MSESACARGVFWLSVFEKGARRELGSLRWMMEIFFMVVEGGLGLKMVFSSVIIM